MRVYHIVYEPSFKSVNIHFWTRCNLSCKACYARYEKFDFGLFDDPIGSIAKRKTPESRPRRFLSREDVIRILWPIEVRYVIFMGTEAGLDPEMPELAYSLHREFNTYNILLTNGMELPSLDDIDEVIFSLKAYSLDIHQEYTGKSNRGILDSFVVLSGRPVKIQAETVLIPGLIDSEEIGRVAQFVSGVDRRIPLRIDAYFPVGDAPWRAATDDEVLAAKEEAECYLEYVYALTLSMKRVGEKPVRLF